MCYKNKLLFFISLFFLSIQTFSQIRITNEVLYDEWANDSNRNRLFHIDSTTWALVTINEDEYLGRWNYTHEKYEEAIPYLISAISKHQISDEAENLLSYLNLLLGISYIKIDQPLKSIQPLSNSISFLSDTSSIYYIMKFTTNRMDDDKFDVSTVEMPLNVDKSSPFYNRAYAKFLLKDLYGARKDLEYALQFGERTEFLGLYSLICYEQENFKDAIEYSTRALNMDNSYEISYFIRGVCKLKLDDDSGCEDLSIAGEKGYTDAYDIIKDHCLKY